MNELIIDKKDLINNLNEIKKQIKKDDYTIIAVVKGNGYGIDSIKLVNFLKENGITFFAVANLEEAIKLRKAGIKEKIMMLTPYSDKDSLIKLIENDIVLTIDSEKCFNEAEKIAEKYNKKINSHIKVDTGLSRYGFDFNEIDKIEKIINKSKNIKFEGIYSHFSNSLAKDSSYSKLQYNRFCKVIDNLEKKGIKFNIKHICNSSGFFKYPEMHLNAARIGSAIIGMASGENAKLKRIGKFHTKIVRVKELKKGDYIGYANSYKAKRKTKIAILPTGYFDGSGKEIETKRYRFLSKVKKCVNDFKNIFKTNNDYMEINNKKLKILGQIGMHDVVLDITDTNFYENEDVYFYVRPILVDSSIERIWK